MSENSVNLTIDGQSIQVPKGTTVYQAARQIKIDIPIFCYHDRMPPFGACRMCLVEVEKFPKLQASCTLEATEGMIVKTQSDPAVKGREEILELLLINHPLDCPICDRGGECPLQDQTLKHGPGQSRFYEEKRHFSKRLPLGPVLMLDRERCIACARCTRFSDVISGDHALEFIERGYRTEVGTPDHLPAKSKFIGNTIQICPVGALTSQVYRFRARPWDNQQTDSTCTLCPVGCSLTLDSRDGEIMRTRSCANEKVNDIWLCDKGWFGYEFSSSPDRIEHPLVRKGNKLEPTTWEEAIAIIASKIKENKAGGKLAAWGGNHLTVEESYLLQKLMREGAGVNHVDHRVGQPIFSLDDEGLSPGMEMSIGECEQLSYAILMGIDLTEEFPVIWLRLRQAINRGAKVIFIGNFAPEIAPYLTQVVLHAPGQELETFKKLIPEIAKLTQSGQKGALFIGRQYLAHPSRKAILAELFEFKQSIQNLSFNVLEGRSNSLGARIAGMHPQLGPLGEKLVKPGLDVLQWLEASAKNGWDYLHIAGANPAATLPTKLWNEARAKLGFLVVQDLFLTETASQADVVLPTLSFVEKEGYFINIEGRVQKLHPGKAIPNTLYSDAAIFVQIGLKLNLNLAVDAPMMDLFKMERVPLNRPNQLEKRAFDPINANGKLIASFAPALFDTGVRMNNDTQLRQLVKEPRVRIHPQEAAKRTMQNDETISLSLNGNSIQAKVQLDKNVAEGTVVVPIGFDQLPVQNLASNLLNGLTLELSKSQEGI